MTETAFASDTAIAYLQAAGLVTSAGGTGEGLYRFVASRNQVADWSADCLDRIKRLRELNQNWDSYGANPVDPRSIEVAKQLVRMFAEVTGIDCPRVAASPAGNVALSWESEDQSRELDLEVQCDGILRYSFLDEHQPSQDIEGETNDPNLIVQLLTQW